MVKVVLGVVTALLLAACTEMSAPVAPQQANAGNPATSGVGHPARDYPGPRAY